MNLRPPSRLACSAAGVVCVLLSAVFGGCSRPEAPVVFNESIAPILTENCYACHGPDPGGRKAGLRLDRAEYAFARHEKSGPAIIPGDPDHSPLILRLEAKDPKRVMPPPEAHKSVSPAQIALLRRWILQGAVYQEHWAFIPPRRPPVPETKQKGWEVNPIDAFVLARLEREHLSPSPEAERPELIRRVTYDLTGLPPSPAEVDAFVRDPSPHAYEKVVDRLLASPRYGEHRAHYWLDVARYGDTHGLHLDDTRPMWPYRDYVIRAYNRNEPYDQFIREQLAGDLLPPVEAGQIVATAFVRAGVSTGEGGTILEELRVNNQRDRTETFGAAFLGLTTGCAVCHDHKFDPITQKDFYQLSAFFNNLTERSSDSGKGSWPPMINVPTPAHRADYDAVLARRAAVLRRMNSLRARRRELIGAWIAGGKNPPRAVSDRGLTAHFRLDEGAGAVLHNGAPLSPAPTIVAADDAPVWGEQTWLWPDFRMNPGTRVTLPKVGDREWNQAFSVGAWIMPHYEDGSSQSRPFGAILARNRGGRGWELFYNHDRVSLRLTHEWTDNRIEVATAEPVLAENRWNHILATYDGSGRAAGIRLYIDGKPRALSVLADRLAGTIRTTAPLEFGEEYPDLNALKQLRFQDVRFYNRALSADEAGRLPREDWVAAIVRRPQAGWNDDELKAVSDYYFAHVDPEMPALAAQLPSLQADLDRLAAGGAPCVVCQESPRLAYADILVRGGYSARAGRVRPDVPHFLPPLPAGAPRNRLSLANWLVSPANPLTARVAVNRMWQEVFGDGIVETTEDFGLMGDRPSHPQLLDWLAVDFRESGWNVKRYYKQLVMSATYRQSARTTPELLARDPRNRLLARGPRFRMDAEMVRDTALAASGLLVEQTGGPSVKPYQPPGVWEVVSKRGSDTRTYVMDHGPSLYRRSLYSFWKRLALIPNLSAFDAPARDGTCTRRQRSDTPLQALVTMNDPQWLEAARCLGERLILHGGSREARLDYLGRLLLARDWRPDERAVLESALTKFRTIYAGRPAAAAQLVAVGEAPRNPKIAPRDLAPWMLVASTALNFDATLNK